MAAKFDAAGNLTNAQDPGVLALDNQPMALDGDTAFEIITDHADVGERAAINVTPVNEVISEQAESATRATEPGVGLCLSGGGYRAMLFHVGSLWRLYEAGQLFAVKRISSVSGGSITSAVLALAWKHLPFDGARGPFEVRVVDPIRELARHTLDADAIIGGPVSYTHLTLPTILLV